MINYTIDFDICEQRLHLRYRFENNALQIKVKIPSDMVNMPRFNFAFQQANKNETYRLAAEATIENFVKYAVAVIPRQVTAQGISNFQLEGTDVFQTKYKSKMITIIWGDSVAEDTAGIDSLNPDYITQITANTAARHSHNNYNLLQSMSYSDGILYIGNEGLGTKLADGADILADGYYSIINWYDNIYVQAYEIPTLMALQVLDYYGETLCLIDDSGYIEKIANQLPYIEEGATYSIYFTNSGVIVNGYDENGTPIKPSYTQNNYAKLIDSETIDNSAWIKINEVADLQYFKFNADESEYINNGYYPLVLTEKPADTVYITYKPTYAYIVESGARKIKQTWVEVYTDIGEELDDKQDVEITDASGYFITNTVEGALDQLGGAVSDINTTLPNKANKVNKVAETAPSLIHLADNTEYRLTDVNNVSFTYPIDDFEVWIKITTAETGTITISYPASRYISDIPTFGNGETWEISIKDRVIAAQQVVTIV